MNRVLGIDPAYRGFGFAVLEDDGTRLIDWGIASCREDLGSCYVAKAERLLHRYQPGVLALEDYRAKDSTRSRRVIGAMERIARLAARHHVRTVRISKAEIRGAFSANGRITKREVAEAITQRFHELRSYLPERREIWLGGRQRSAIWMGEHHRMCVFDAVALAITSLSR